MSLVGYVNRTQLVRVASIQDHAIAKGCCGQNRRYLSSRRRKPKRLLKRLPNTTRDRIRRLEKPSPKHLMEKLDNALENAGEKLESARKWIFDTWAQTPEGRRTKHVLVMDGRWWFWNIAMALSPAILLGLYCEFIGQHDMRVTYARVNLKRSLEASGEPFTEEQLQQVLDSEVPPIPPISQRIRALWDDCGKWLRGDEVETALESPWVRPPTKQADDVALSVEPFRVRDKEQTDNAKDKDTYYAIDTSSEALSQRIEALEARLERLDRQRLRQSSQSRISKHGDQIILEDQHGGHKISSTENSAGDPSDRTDPRAWLPSSKDLLYRALAVWQSEDEPPTRQSEHQSMAVEKETRSKIENRLLRRGQQTEYPNNYRNHDRREAASKDSDGENLDDSKKPVDDSSAEPSALFGNLVRFIQIQKDLFISHSDKEVPISSESQKATETVHVPAKTTSDVETVGKVVEDLPPQQAPESVPSTIMAERSREIFGREEAAVPNKSPWTKILRWDRAKESSGKRPT